MLLRAGLRPAPVTRYLTTGSAMRQGQSFLGEDRIMQRHSGNKQPKDEQRCSARSGLCAREGPDERDGRRADAQQVARGGATHVLLCQWNYGEQKKLQRPRKGTRHVLQIAQGWAGDFLGKQLRAAARLHVVHLRFQGDSGFVTGRGKQAHA